MKVLMLCLVCAGPAAAWSWGPSRPAEAVFEVESTGNPAVDGALSDRAVAVLRKRVAVFGLDGTVEKRAGGRVAIVIDAHADDPGVLLRPLLKPARLEFRIVRWDRKKPGPGETTTTEFTLDDKTGALKQTVHVLDKVVILTGADILEAGVAMNQYTKKPEVTFKFGPAGAAALEKATTNALGRRMAVTVDGRAITVATIVSAITGGVMAISDGIMTERSATDLARALSSGPLPERLALVHTVVDGKLIPAEPAAAAPARAAKGPAAEAAAPAVVSDVDVPPPALARGRANGFAVVIGVERTRQGLPRADFAAKDATVFASYLIKTLGYSEENVVLLVDERAAKSDLEKYLEDWLPRKAGPGATVVVYFSGHGAPDAAHGTSYLVPYDGDPAYLGKTAFPLKRLYETLGKLKGRRSIVLLDACFSGAGRRSALAKGARPLVAKQEPVEPPANLAVLSASASNQIGGSYDAQGHGLFTYYLLRSLRDAAADGRAPTLQQLFDSVAGKVEAEARRLTGNEQTPQLEAGVSSRAGSL